VRAAFLLGPVSSAMAEIDSTLSLEDDGGYVLDVGNCVVVRIAACNVVLQLQATGE
jgi:hypothetical protein